ncbi:ABC transporter permease subunit [Shewanella surugensis]|uniref:ABC transporter permease subunit n=1 Tax=Shewanella surugensis TaxID=212020 RepID=A0ABT0L8B3_9GAMM|nr:ABC transporter permease subunit [Shewanella surugensis]MCL1123932.1 ABC transporter permease subunit [Shewanella surugensis]
MGRYLLRRFNLFIATSIILIAVLFIATDLFPAHKTFVLSGIAFPTASETIKINNEFKLDENKTQQFVAYLWQKINGNMGVSVASQQPINAELIRVLPASYELALTAGFLAFFFGFPVGMLVSLSKNKIGQNTIMAFILAGYSNPVVWLGPLIALWFGIKLGWLPTSGQINLLYDIKPVTGFMLIDTLLSDSPHRLSAFYSAIRHIILPAVTLAILPFTAIVRITRAAMMNIMNQSFIQAAEARGLHTSGIVLRHALPNAFIPVLKNLGLMLGSFTGYGILVEMVFAWPGVGFWLISGIEQRDYTVIQGGILAVSLNIIFLSIMIDIIHTAYNPLSKKEIYASN